MNYYLLALKKYVEFKGRASRPEYWYFFLFNLIFAIGFGIIDSFFSAMVGDKVEVFSDLYTLAVLLPGIAAGVRRMHDINKSGWFILIPIYNIFLLARAGDIGENRFGTDPKATAGLNESVTKTG
jgi:uncharacterized membrane protein YhaH (DUF805 family)